jgi:hypothetical protein
MHHPSYKDKYSQNDLQWPIPNTKSFFGFFLIAYLSQEPKDAFS